MISNRRTSRSRRMENGTVLTRSKISRAVRRALSLARSKRNYVEDLAASSESGLLKLTQRRTWLLPAFIFGLVTTAFVWVAALRFPYAASGILLNGFNSNLPSRYSILLTVLVMSIPFAPPYLSAFALGNLLFPSSLAPEIALGVMSTFEYRQKSNRRWLIVIAAGMLGALNCILLVIAISSATGN
jgi:hypothetical protein